MYPYEMLRTHDTVFILYLLAQNVSSWYPSVHFSSDECCLDITYLAGRIHDFRGIVLSLISNRPTVRTFDCRIITFCELILDELYRQGTFACEKFHVRFGHSFFEFRDLN